jgi:hypothetical protein
VEEETFANLTSTKDEFSAIKSQYMKKALRTHPDKGGDEAQFRELQEAWETIRGAFEEKEVPAAGFGSYFKGTV